MEIRPFTWQDLTAIARLHRAAQDVDGARRDGNVHTLDARWRKPEMHITERCLVAYRGTTLLGYGLRTPGGAEGFWQAEGLVHPDWRRRGVGRALFQALAQAARQDGGRALDLRVRDDEAAAEALARSLGLHLVRRWQRLWLDPLCVEPVPFPAGYGWHTLRPAEDLPHYVELMRAAFVPEEDLAPTTVEQVRALLANGVEPANIVLASHSRHETVGLCVVSDVVRNLGTRECQTAHIGPLAVHPEHRRRGLGRALLALSLARAQRRGLTAAELAVEEGNIVASRLYERMGFQLLYRVLWYRMELN